MSNAEEYICDKCNGTGEITLNSGLTTRGCPKCLGEGKLNWLEHIFGKQRPELRRLNANWTFETAKDLTALYDVDLQAEIINTLAEEMAYEIDKEIMKSLLETTPQPEEFSKLLGFEDKEK